MSLKNIKILLGITGGIAAYKSAELCRMFIKEGADVRVIMSESACQFITPLTMETLSKKPVLVKMFGRTEGPLEHIEIPDEADVMVIAPATADYLARSATGRASDLISSVTLAFTKSIVAAPAMNTNMWNNPATQQNIKTLKTILNWKIVSPESGKLACGWTGQGRMAKLESIVEAVSLLSNKVLKNKTLLITAGPTIEDLDPVRFLSNRSTGNMGYTIATVAKAQGANVILISGPTNLPAPEGVQIINVRSTLEMEKAVNNNADNCDAIIMSAAVADYRPETIQNQKIKKSTLKNETTIKLVKNPDILAGLGNRFEKDQKVLLIGFALETQNLIKSATKKLKEKKAHMIVANFASDGLGGTTTEAILIDKNGNQQKTGQISKNKLAKKIINYVSDYFNQLPP